MTEPRPDLDAAARAIYDSRLAGVLNAVGRRATQPDWQDLPERDDMRELCTEAADQALSAAARSGAPTSDADPGLDPLVSDAHQLVAARNAATRGIFSPDVSAVLLWTPARLWAATFAVFVGQAALHTVPSSDVLASRVTEGVDRVRDAARSRANRVTVEPLDMALDALKSARPDSGGLAITLPQPHPLPVSYQFAAALDLLAVTPMLSGGWTPDADVSADLRDAVDRLGDVHLTMAPERAAGR